MATCEDEHYRSLFENSLVPMLLVDLGTESIVRANGAAEQFYGLGPGAMTNLPISEIETMDPSDVSRVMSRQFEEPVQSMLLRRHRRADGSLRDVEVRIGPMPDIAGRMAYVIITDVTSREAAIRELDDHRTRLERLLEERAMGE